MGKFERLLKEVKMYGGKIFNVNDIIQLKTFSASKEYKGNDNECTYKISQDKDDLISLRVDSNKIKIAVTSFIGNKLIKTFVLLPTLYKCRLYRDQIITYLLERNQELINKRTK